MVKRLSLIVLLVILASNLASSLASAARAEPAEPRKLDGSFSVAYAGYDSVPLLVGLNDASGLFGKDPVYLLPRTQQVLGTYKGIASNGAYSLALPEKPQGRAFDISGSATPNPNLMIFDVRLLSDVASRGYMAQNEDPIASSLRVSIDFRVEGGKLLVWTANDKEQFSSDRGADKQFFTADDPKGTLPAGWSVIDLDQEPFEVLREAELTINLITTGMGDSVDYSSLSCADLIPTFLDRVQGNYPFTELHKIDWEALRAKLIPASQTARTPADCQAIIRDFGNAIPDGHVNYRLPALADELGGALGIRLDSTSDGQVVVVLVRADSPADKAGIKTGAIITQWDGKPIQEALDNLVLQFSNSSTPHGLIAVRLSQLPFGKLGTSVRVTFQNPGQQPTTATLTRVEPQPARGSGSATPDVRDNKLPSGLGYIRISSFITAANLRGFDRAVDGLIEDNVPGIIIDVRSNPGGFSQISDAMASRFFDKGFVVGRDYTSDGRLRFMMMVDPRPPIYSGPVVILVNRNTASAGDLFAYTFKLARRATIVGHTPSAGMAGTVSGGQYTLPDGAFIQVPTGGFTDDSGKLAVEGVGVVPDIVVPVTIESLLSSQDSVLDAAVASFKLEAAR